MHRLSCSTVLLFALLGFAATAHAQEVEEDDAVLLQDTQGDVLLIERVQIEPANLPSRGMSMAQVEARFGAPAERLDPRGGQKSDWPTINRWVYPAFTVYFERSKVIDVVMTKGDPNEIGPKPPTT